MLVYAANELTAKEDLQAVIAESLGANFNVDEFSEKFPRGNNIGEYNQAKYDAFMALSTSRKRSSTVAQRLPTTRSISSW